MTRRPGLTTALLDLRVGNGALEALKWFAVALMTADHVNKYLFNESSAIVFAAGRVVMPVFAFVLAFNLARPNAFERGVHLRVMVRLAVFAAVATGPFVALGGLISGWYPLNILWMLFVATSAIYMFERNERCARGNHWWAFAAVATIAIGGAFVEFWWLGVCLVVFAWCYLKRPSAWAALCWFLSLLTLSVVNGNYWAAAAVVPLAVAMQSGQVTLPRAGGFCYFYYPLHLAMIYALKMIA